MKCAYCENIKNKVYEDSEAIAFLADKPSAPGHIILIPKKHHTILEQIPDPGSLFNLANELSSILFDVLQAEGTNIIVQNGINQKVPHVSFNIIPRKEKDNLNLDWQPKQIDKEEMSVIELKLKECCQKIVIGKKEEKETEIKQVVEKPKNTEWIEKILFRLP